MNRRPPRTQMISPGEAVGNPVVHPQTYGATPAPPDFVRQAEATTVPLLNESGGRVQVGTVVTLGTEDTSFTTSSTIDDITIHGATYEDVEPSISGRIAVQGKAPVLVASGTTAGQYLRQSSVAGIAEGTATPTPGSFARAITDRDANGLVSAILGRFPLFPGSASLYGDGSDGDATISGNTTLAAAKMYDNLTVDVGVVLNMAGYPVFVAGTLTNNGTIRNNGGAGGNASGTTAGTAGSAPSVGILGTAAQFPGGIAGVNGKGGSGGASNGDPGNAATVNVVDSVGGSTALAGVNGVAGGDGDGGSGGTGGTGGAAGTRTAATAVFRTMVNMVLFRMITGTTLLVPSTNAQNGGAGGSGSGADDGGSDDGGDSGGSGGGGGNGGPSLIVARLIVNNGAIQANGGAGGNGAAGQNSHGSGAGGGGGGSGGNGGNGGLLVIISQSPSLSGYTAAGGAAGTGAAGGSGNGSGLAGATGNNGNAGVTGVALFLTDSGS